MNTQCEEFLKVMHDWKRVTCKMRCKLIPHGELFTLVTIAELCDASGGNEQGVKVSELVHKLKTSKPGISKKLKYLEEKKYISRVIAPEDKRVMLIAPTKEGREVMKQAKDEMDSFLEKVLVRMGEGDTKQFLKLCVKLQDAMYEEMKLNDERMKKEHD